MSRIRLRRLTLVVLVTPLLVTIVLYTWTRARSPWTAVSVVAPIGAGTVGEDRRPVRFATFNIAHGRGPVEGASNWQPPADERRARLVAIGRLLRELDVDVAALQEVDFDAVWSDHLDQTAVIADAAGLAHIVRQRNLDVAFPFVRLRFGNAILSRYPIDDARRIRFEAYSAIESLVTGNHDALLARIRLPGDEPVAVWAVHLEVRSEETRIRAAEAILDRAGTLDVPLIVLGDLNSTPAHFPHAEPLADGTTALDRLVASGRFGFAPPADHPADFSFPSDAPRRLIDWILHPPDWTPRDTTVVPTTLSDHRPVVTTLTPP